jgi:hypothetical protein
MEQTETTRRLRDDQTTEIRVVSGGLYMKF